MRASDRARMRNDLRELAKQASGRDVNASTAEAEAEAEADAEVPLSAISLGHGLGSADSSGCVDLSAFSAVDDGWVEKEFARARGGAVLSPGSIRPISIDALIEKTGVAETRGSRKRGWVYSSLGLAGVAAIAALAVAIGRHLPRTQAPTAAAVPPPTLAPTPTPTPNSAPITVAVAAPDPPPSSKKRARSHVPASSPAHVAASKPAAVAAAAPQAKPVVIPPPKSAGSSSLMDLIKASVAKK